MGVSKYVFCKVFREMTSGVLGVSVDIVHGDPAQGDGRAEVSCCRGNELHLQC